MNTNRKAAVSTLIGCSLLTFSIMGLYSCPTIFLVSVSEELGVGIGSLSLYITLQNLAMALSVPFSIRLIQKKNVNILMSFAVLCGTAAVFSMGFFHSVYPFYAAGILAGIACSFLSYMVIPLFVNPWFEKSQGTALAAVLAFIGLGSTFYNTIGSRIITSYGWRRAYMILSVMTLLLALPCTLVLIRKKEAPEEEASVSAPGNEKTDTLRKALRTPSLWLGLFSVICFCLIASCYSHMTGFASTMTTSLSRAALCASVYMLGVTAGKFVIGICNDRLGLQKTLLGVGIVSGTAMLLFTTHPFGYSGMLACVFVVGIGAANNSLLSPLLIKALYGDHGYAEKLSFFSMASGIAAAFAITIFGWIRDLSGRYEPVFFIVTAVIFAGTICGSLCLRNSEGKAEESRENASSASSSVPAKET